MKKILMIEDNEDHALLIRRSIEDTDCAVIHYSDGIQAVKACESFQKMEERPDLIFLDLKLPGMDGFEVLTNLKKISLVEHVPVIILTTSSRKEEVAKAYRLGASGFIVKSDDFTDLKEKLKTAKQYWFSIVEPCVPAGRPSP